MWHSYGVRVYIQTGCPGSNYAGKRTPYQSPLADDWDAAVHTGECNANTSNVGEVVVVRKYNTFADTCYCKGCKFRYNDIPRLRSSFYLLSNNILWACGKCTPISEPMAKNLRTIRFLANKKEEEHSDDLELRSPVILGEMISPQRSTSIHRLVAERLHI